MSEIREKDDHQTVEALKQFDLNEYEAKTFIALLNIGDAPASEISELAGVPQSRVYDILRSLARKGLITKQPTSPKKYSANYARRSLEHLIYRIGKAHEERLSHLRNQKEMLIDVLPERSDINKNPNDIRTVKGTYAIACKLIEGMQDCRESLKIVGDSPFVRLKSQSSFDNQIGDRAIDIKGIGMFDNDEIIEMYRHDASIKKYDHNIQSFFLFDDTRLLQVDHSGSTPIGVYTEESSLVQTYADRFERLWSNDCLS